MQNLASILPKIVSLSGLLLLSACGPSGAAPTSTAEPHHPENSKEALGASCAWPKEKAAVSLTYDDATPTQLTTAAPALRRHGLRATFFLTDVRSNPAPWTALRNDGHELAAHTFKHPCPTSNGFVKEGDANEDYDFARMERELDENLEMLKSLGEIAPFTFAYPCGVTWIGAEHKSYVPLVEERFLAARGVASQTAGHKPDLMNVATYFLKTTSAELIRRLDEARADKSWVVFGFHGIGGDWETLPTDAHEEFLAHLAAHPDEFYVAPFREIAACLNTHSG